MKKSKTIFAILALAAAVLLAGQPAAQAGEGLELWPLTEGVNGQTFFGTLLIIYKVVDPLAAECSFFEPSATMTFHLTLFKNRANSWSFMATNPGPFCLRLDVGSEAQQAALLSFLNYVVRPNLKGGKFSQIFLTKVNEDFFDTRLDGGGSPPSYNEGTIVEYTVADVEVVAK